MTPGSTNATRAYAPNSDKSAPALLLAFEELTRGDFSLSVSDSTAITAHPILFAAAQVTSATRIRSSSRATGRNIIRPESRWLIDSAHTWLTVHGE